MLDFFKYLGYGAIGISMACAILSYRLLAHEQKKAKPNESVLKMIRLFFGLTIFFALFFGVVEVFKAGGGGELDSQTAAEYLKNVDSSTYVLNSTPGSAKADVVVNFGNGGSVTLGTLMGDPTKDLTAKKSKDRTHWEVFLRETPLGQIETEWNEYRILADSTQGKEFRIGVWYPISESDLWFRINEIVGKGVNYGYNVSYAEGTEISDLIIARRSMDYARTREGAILMSQQYGRIYHTNWTKQYFVKFGAGQIQTGGESVQKLNIDLISVALK